MSLLVILAAGLAAVAVLTLAAATAAVAWHVHRERRQPVFPAYRPGPAGRRETDRRAHPDEADTDELPALPR